MSDEIDWEKYLECVKKLETNKKAAPVKQADFRSLKNPQSNYKILTESYDFGLFDRKVKKKISSRRTEIDGKLDLHGLSLLEAKEELHKFVVKCYNEHKTNLIVITGQGFNSADKERTIKSSFDKFMSSMEIKPFVLSYTEASIKDGGKGAYYIVLRRFK